MFNTRITKTSTAAASTNSIKAPAAKGNAVKSKNIPNEYGHTKPNKGIATTVKLNGKIVATKITNDPSHPVKSTVLTNGFASSNGPASTSAAKSTKLSYNGKGPRINGNG